jgi:hypothetical protein
MRTLLLLIIVATSVNAQTNTITFQSSTDQTPLLELYTSEGCSSCPPAETRLSQLKKSSGLWKDFVPVAFHVDYWDDLGWRDPWGSAEFSKRQRLYAAQLRSHAVYTPEFVLNGREYHDWARKELPQSPRATVGVITAVSNDKAHWQITFTPARSSPDEYEVHAALLVSGLVSDVKAGENRGRRLNHDFVTVALVSGQLVQKGNSLESEIRFGLPSRSENELALAVWVAKAGRLEPLQATGGWLR